MTGLTGVTSLSTGSHFSRAATPTTVECWGYGEECELGNCECTTSFVPIAMSNLPGASQVAVGFASACAVVGFSAYCWGDDAIDNAAVSPFQQAGTPAPVTGLTTGVTPVAGGFATACAVVNSGVQCWGYNSAGQLGNGGATNDLVAAPVTGFQ